MDEFISDPMVCSENRGLSYCSFIHCTISQEFRANAYAKFMKKKVAVKVESKYDVKLEVGCAQEMKSEQTQNTGTESALQSEVFSLTSEKKLVEEISALKKQNNNACFDLHTKTKALSAMQSAKETAELKLEDFKLACGNKMKCLRGKMAERDRTIADFKIENKNLSRELKDAKSDLIQCANKIKFEVEQSAEKTKKIAHISRENRHLKARIDQYHSNSVPIQTHGTSSMKKNDVSRSASTNEYEVERLVSHKIENRDRYFLVRWKGYTRKHDTWESQNNLTNCPKILNEYLKTNNLGL